MKRTNVKFQFVEEITNENHSLILIFSMKEKVGVFCDFQITRATYFHQTRYVLSIKNFLGARIRTFALHYRSSLRNIFVHLFCGTTTKRIIRVEAWRLVSMVKNGGGEKKKKKKNKRKRNKFAKSVSTKRKRQKRFCHFWFLKSVIYSSFQPGIRTFFFLVPAMPVKYTAFYSWQW